MKGNLVFEGKEGLTEENIKIIWNRNKDNFEKKMATWLARIKNNKKSIQDNRAKFHEWYPLRIYLSVTDARIGQFSVRFLGQEVAKIRIQNDVAFLVISTKHEKTNENYFKCKLKKGEYPWIGKEAIQFRAYFKKVDCKKIEIRSQEHKLESDFIQEMLKEDLNKFGGKLKNIQPVTIEGMPFQMPLPISASKGVPIASGHGHIDILARRRGNDRKVRISVWELKEPRGNINHVIEQVYIYAVVLLYMLRSNYGQDWYKLFGFNGKIPAKLEIEAVVAVSAKKKEDCIKKFKEFIGKNSLYMDLNGDTIKFFIGLYDWDDQDNLRVNLVDPLNLKAL